MAFDLFLQRRKLRTPAVTRPTGRQQRSWLGGSWFPPRACAPGSLCNCLLVSSCLSFSVLSVLLQWESLKGISWWLIVLSIRTKISTHCYRSCVSRGFCYSSPSSLNMFSSAGCKFDSYKPWISLPVFWSFK